MASYLSSFHREAGIEPVGDGNVSYPLYRESLLSLLLWCARVAKSQRDSQVHLKFYADLSTHGPVRAIWFGAFITTICTPFP